MVAVDFYDFAQIGFFSCCFSCWVFSCLLAFLRMLRCLAMLAS